MIFICAKCEKPYETNEKAPCPVCGSEGVPAPQPESALIIRFAGVDRTEFEMHPIGKVTPGQLEVVGAFLMNRARDMWSYAFAETIAKTQEEETEEPQIVVPSMVPGVAAQVMRDVKR